MPKLIVKNRYGVVPNEILNSKKLSLKAKGLFAYLQSKPDGWKFSITRMAQQLKEGKDAIREAIKELERWGLLRRKPIKDKNGKWAGFQYELHEKLAEKPSTENPTTVNPTTVIPDSISKKEYSKKEYSKKEYSKNLKDFPKLVVFMKEKEKGPPLEFYPTLEEIEKKNKR